MNTESKIRHVRDTAYWMASYRAEESERQDALFCDPLARELVGEHGKRITASMAYTARYSSWILVIRTCLIDDLIRKFVAEGYAVFVNLGVGLDTRPYRLDLPESVNWIEMDSPEIIELKNEKLKNHNPSCQLERIAVDLSDRPERQRVFSEINNRIGPAVVLAEGLVPYLTEDVVCDLAEHLSEIPKFKLWITEYYSPKLYPFFQGKKFQDSLGDSPFRFFPKDWFGVLEDCGWTKKEIRYLYEEGERLGRRFPAPWFVLLFRAFVKKETIAKHMRLQAYAVLGRSRETAPEAATRESAIG